MYPQPLFTLDYKMSKTTEDPTKYYRTGIAIKVDRRPILDQRLAALGLGTVGDLVTFFIGADGVVEALSPLLEKYNSENLARKNGRVTKKVSLDALSRMSPEELANLLALAKINQKIEA